MNWKSGLLLVVMVIALAGCGGGSTPPPPPPPAISVHFSPAAPTSIAIGKTASVTAVVSNDAAGMGVNWSCTPANSCGSFSPTTTASGAATTYTAPAAVPQGGIATIIATSISDSSKNANAGVNISGIVVTITTGPTVVPQGTTANFVATVANDAAAAGINWSCTPAGATNCGTFSPTMTASNVSTTYTPPAKGASVTIIATSVTDPKASGNLPIIVPGAASNATLKGQYAFLIRAQVGNQTSRKNTTFAGSVSLDGAGNVTGGVEDIVSPLYNDQDDPICPTLIPGPCGAPTPISTYKVDANGHGLLTIRTFNNETLVMSLIVTSANHAEVIETGGDPGSGTLDLQTTSTGMPGGFANSQISGSYAFTLDGVNASMNPTVNLSFGGVFQSVGTGTITGGTLDTNKNGVFTTSGPGIGGSVLVPPDANGRGQIHFSPGVAGSSGNSFRFYIVNNRVLRLIEDDGSYYMGGSAYLQGVVPAQPGKFVYQHSGWNSAGTAWTVAAGQFTTSMTGTITAGMSDSNAGGSPTVANTAIPVTGTYSPTASPATLTLTDASGTAAVLNIYPVDPTLNILDPNNTSGGGGALLLHTDANIVGTGVLLPQNVTATTTILGSNALNLENAIAAALTPKEVALVGVFNSDGSGNLTNGLADYDQDDPVNGPNTVMLQAPFTGVCAADINNAGRCAGGFTIPTTMPLPLGGYTFILPSPTPNFFVTVYQATGVQAFVIQTDTLANSIGRIIQQQLP